MVLVVIAYLEVRIERTEVVPSIYNDGENPDRMIVVSQTALQGLKGRAELRGADINDNDNLFLVIILTIPYFDLTTSICFGEEHEDESQEDGDAR
jgi:hypothetical protein